jgi:hypothetical protein
MEPGDIRTRVREDFNLTPFVTASLEDIRHAHELRERLRQLLPDRPCVPVPVWSVGVD